MPIRLANNAAAHLAAPLADDGDTIVLVTTEVGNFPALTAGDWFPLTLADAAGNLEIVRVTARSGNILTCERAQENSAARVWNAGDRAEIRFTAGAFEALRQETADAVSAALAQANDTTASAILANEPVGTMKPWSLTTEPAGWLFCDGRTLTSATSHPELRAAYINAGFPFGQDGSGNPKIPDLRGRAPVGVDNMGSGAAARLTGATLGAGLGAEKHTLSAVEMPTHSHGVTDAGHSHAMSDPGHGHSVYDPGHTHAASTSSAGAHTHTVSAWSNTGGGISVSATGAGVTAQSTLTTSSHAGHSHGVTVNAAGTGMWVYGAATGITMNAATTGIATQDAGSGGAHNNVQPSLAVHWIVKAG